MLDDIIIGSVVGRTNLQLNHMCPIDQKTDKTVKTYHDNKGLKLWEPFGVDIFAKLVDFYLLLVNLSS